MHANTILTNIRTKSGGNLLDIYKPFLGFGTTSLKQPGSYLIMKC